MKSKILLISAACFLLAILAGCATQPQQELSHFKCYLASGDEPHEFIALLTDQFGTARTAVGKPRYLCAPVKKELVHGTPRPTPKNADHLVCYLITGNQATSRTIDNQLQTQNLAILNPELLCVPTYKMERKGDGEQPPPR